MSRRMWVVVSVTRMEAPVRTPVKNLLDSPSWRNRRHGDNDGSIDDDTDKTLRSLTHRCETFVEEDTVSSGRLNSFPELPISQGYVSRELGKLA